MSGNASQWLGQVVDRKFELRELVGSSPTSWVFLTEREGQKAAIKLISANQRQSGGRISSLEQARNLSHPNLIRVYQTGRCRIGETALVYVVMEYADENLREILTQRALTALEVSEMLPPVLDALSYLHGKGRVHGHIKPANILATGDQVKISSDAICAMAEIPAQPSAYDAPETAKRGYSASGDVWSLGLTLVETLAQNLPAVTLNATDDPALPDSLPQPFLDIARECLRRDPARRARLSDISARLRAPTNATRVPASEPVPVVRAALPTVPKAVTKSPSRRTQSAWRHAIPAAVLLGLAVVVILVAPKVLNRLQGQSEGAAASEPARSMAGEKPIETTQSASAPVEKSDETSNAATPAAPPQRETSAPEAVAPTKTANNEAAPGDVVQQLVPDVPRKALDTIQGTVKVGVRVQVDAAGDVTDANLDSPGPSKYFANLAMTAARGWKFSPAAGSDTGTREWTLRFRFTQDGTKVASVPTRP